MRLPHLADDQMNDAQRRVAAETTAGKRGHVPAPLLAWLHSPELGARAQRLGEFVRYDTVLGPYLSELAILVTARAWTAQYEWYAHKREALKAGVAPAVIDAIAAQRAPVLDDPKARLVYEYAHTLHGTRTIPASLHADAVRLLGEQGVVDLVGLLGYYTLVAMTLNAFDIGAPAGEVPELT